MEIYNKVKGVPKNAQKAIKGGRLNGMTDINPMWRIAMLTELFGPCGMGWKYTITRREMIPGANDEVSCFVDVDLFYKWDGVWSEPIPGTGGASYIAKESRGLYTSDECYKMALTDALSVACKALGVGADIYWEGGRSKYSTNEQTPSTEQPQPKKAPPRTAAPIASAPLCECCGKEVAGAVIDGKQYTANTIAARAISKYGVALCLDCLNEQNQKFEEAKKAAEAQ
jgi:hypothetical protein